MANKEYVNLTGLTVYDEAIKDYISENTPVLVEIEQADYDELTPAQKMDENYYYYIKDASTVGADTIGQLSDVAITTPSNGDVLQYNETNANWENSPIPTANIDTIKVNGTALTPDANKAVDIITDEWTSTSTVQSDNTVTFSGLNDNYGYKLYCENKVIGISAMTKTGSGTSVTLVFTVTDASAGDVCKLRILK